ncbi:M48 family metallopeptidase [Aquincola sp. S2]|uniref:M48 family metallopeptidase n=1 Tax=Pseudaquabacterium terrae TaxID=2732868 RepID=A0ABX2EDD4_9BURK|nr:SprT family zinc-dependent metalloprotease [Aquabacterium terrae]NRF66085.1 M48 family metallopeptidase [Aquabacterium terrae]
MAWPSHPPEHPEQLSLFDGASPAPALPPERRVDGAAAPPPPATPAPMPRFQHPRAQRHIDLGEHRVAYEFRRGRRRSIGFVVSAEGLSVSAPRWVGVGEVEQALQSKADWILRKLHEQQQRAERMQANRVRWHDGTSLPFLGETVIVVLDPRVTGAVLHSDAEALPGVPKLTLHVGLPQSASEAQIREAVQSWLQRQARRIFEERCALFAPRLGVRMKRLSLSSASTRWGSASVDGSVRLNWRLVHFGLPVIDYVVTHELAHLREMNHSAAFWEVVRSVLPDFEQRRGLLRTELLPAFD